MEKFALLQRQFLPKMYKSVGYLQNYSRTDKKKKEKKNPIHLWTNWLILFMQIDVETACGDNLIRHLETLWTIEYFNKNPFTCLFVFNPFPELQ